MTSKGLKILILCTILVLLHTGRDSISSTRGPRIAFEESRHDFGPVYRGERVKHNFLFLNIGDGELEIYNVKASCGCTAVAPSQRHIPPGGQAMIEVTFSPHSFAGKVVKTVVVDSNDPVNPHYTLTVEAEIKEEVTAQPRQLTLGQIKRGEPLTKQIEIRATTALELVVSEAKSSSPILSIEEINNRPDGSYLLTVKLKEDAPLGRFWGALAVYTNSTRQPTLSIPFFGEVISDVSVFPPRVSYGVVTRGKAALRQLLITIHEKDVRLTAWEVSSEYLSLRGDLQGQGSSMRLDLILREDAPPGKLEGTVKIYTTSKEQPVITIPVYAVVKGG